MTALISHALSTAPMRRPAQWGCPLVLLTIAPRRRGDQHRIFKPGVARAPLPWAGIAVMMVLCRFCAAKP